MPIGKITVSDEGPSIAVRSNQYSEVYAELENLPVGKWVQIPITEKDAKALATEINQVRRAVQRWFYEAAHKSTFKYESRVENKSATTSVMWVRKELL